MCVYVCVSSFLDLSISRFTANIHAKFSFFLSYSKHSWISDFLCILSVFSNLQSIEVGIAILLQVSSLLWEILSFPLSPHACPGGGIAVRSLTQWNWPGLFSFKVWEHMAWTEFTIRLNCVFRNPIYPFDWIPLVWFFFLVYFFIHLNTNFHWG